jgi:hypothetical protein
MQQAPRDYTCRFQDSTTNSLGGRPMADKLPDLA